MSRVGLVIATVTRFFPDTRKEEIDGVIESVVLWIHIVVDGFI